MRRRSVVRRKYKGSLSVASRPAELPVLEGSGKEDVLLFCEYKETLKGAPGSCFIAGDTLSPFALPPPATLDNCFIQLFCFMFRSTPSPPSVSVDSYQARSHILTTSQSSSLSSLDDSPKHVRIYSCLHTLPFRSSLTVRKPMYWHPQNSLSTTAAMGLYNRC